MSKPPVPFSEPRTPSCTHGDGAALSAADAPTGFVMTIVGGLKYGEYRPRALCQLCGAPITSPDGGIVVYPGDYQEVTSASVTVLCKRNSCSMKPGPYRHQLWEELGDFIAKLAQAIGMPKCGDWKAPRKGKKN